MDIFEAEGKAGDEDHAGDKVFEERMLDDVVKELSQQDPRLPDARVVAGQPGVFRVEDFRKAPDGALGEGAVERLRVVFVGAALASGRTSDGADVHLVDAFDVEDVTVLPDFRLLFRQNA